MTFEGKCDGRRLRVTLQREALVVETLNGTQAGSMFTHELAELKHKPDLIVDRTTRLYSGALLGMIFFGFLALICAAHWGEGIATQAFWVCAGLTGVSAFILSLAPKKRVYLWSTKGGVQAFGLESTRQNENQLRQFLEKIELSIAAHK
jgi:hypothetical protein